ncbi:MAG: hypothetical protein DRQ78_08020 [Epsilonproteobacteria bacterium]|nr:MAG: hypothetical protein DRQ78_08020 [Campylobacterota bacterium]
MGIFNIGVLENTQTPIEKVQTALQSVIYMEIKKRRNSTLRDNLIIQPTFVGINPETDIIDPEDEEVEGKEARYTAQVEYVPSEEVTHPDGHITIEKTAPMVMLDQEWVEEITHHQLVEFFNHILGEELTTEAEGDVKTINEDYTDYDNLTYKIKESTASEVEAKITRVEEDGVSCDTEGVAKDMTKKDAESIEAKESDKSKTTSDTRATFTKMKGKMDGDIQQFIGSGGREMSAGDISRIQEVQDILEDGMRFQGVGKAKTISPSKRLNMRAIITEASENEYIGKKEGSGKRTKIMLTIDRSGSMSGQPTTESNVLMSALNNIVLENSELEVEVMLSFTGAYTKFKLPIGSEQFSPYIWNLTQTGDAEYLWQNMKNNMESLENADINIVYTDGSICDDPIDKTFLERRDTHITGLYVSSAMGVDNLKEHYKRNKMYFHHVVVRPSIQELAEEISTKIFSERSTR